MYRIFQVLSSPSVTALTVAVGGIAVRFEGLSEQLKTAALERYGPFLSEEAPIHTATVFEGPTDYLDMAEDKFLRLEEREFPEGRIRLPHFRRLAAARRREGLAKGILRTAPSQRHRSHRKLSGVGGRRPGPSIAGLRLVRRRPGKDGKSLSLFGYPGGGRAPRRRSLCGRRREFSPLR